MTEKSIAKQKVLIYYPERCTGCKYCEMGCSLVHFGEINLEKSHIHALFDEKTNEFEALVCQHCEDPVCAASCPVEAIVVDEKTGWVKINPMKCISCKTCIYACPVSMPWFSRDHKIAMKCDFCDPVRDGKPICVEFCSPRALEVVTRKEAWDFFRKRYLQGEE